MKRLTLVLIGLSALSCQKSADRAAGATSASASASAAPGGALLAAEMLGDTSDAAFWAAAIIGGSVTALVHGAKTGSRAFINASPEPFSNWAASLSEDALALGGLWAAFLHPVPFLIGLVVFIVAAAWLVWRLAGLLRALPSRVFASARNDSAHTGSKQKSR